MIIKNMFSKPIDRDIKGVIKVGQDDDANIKQELEEYVVTRELQKHFSDFFASYKRGITGNTDKMGVWISGFFGSGKSHFLKILSYLLENKEVGGKKAIDYFVDDNKISDQMVLADMKLAGTIPTDVVLFNIDSKSEVNGKQSKVAIVSVLQNVFNEMQGFSGSNPFLADLERKLTEEGKYNLFKEKFEDSFGSAWEESRSDFDFIQDDVVEVLDEIGFMSIEAGRNWCEKATGEYTYKVEDFARLVKKYLDKKESNHHIVFLIDEIGQYIGDDSKLMLNLQTVTEDLGTACGGKAWIIVTSQQDIDSITKTKGNDFSKIQGRFDTRLSLSSANVDEVIKKRILEKNEAGKQTLTLLYDDKATVIKNLILFNDGVEKKLYSDRENFADIYPFIPYQFNLLGSVLTSIRTHGASGKHLAEGERSMLALFKESAVKVMNDEPGTIVPFNMFYDALEQFLDHSHKGVISRALDNEYLNPNHEKECFDVNVLKTLFMIKYVKEIKANIENITSLMVSNVNDDRMALAQQVEDALKRLVRQTLVQKNGDIYVFLTDEEQEINRAIESQNVDSGEVIAKVSEMIFDGLYDEKKYRYPAFNGRYAFAFNQVVDDKPYKANQNNDITLKILTPNSDERADETTMRILSGQSSCVLVVLPDDRTFLDEIRSALQIEKFIRFDATNTVTQFESIKEAKKVEMRERKDRVVVIISDALRYEVAHTLFEKMQADEKCNASIGAMQGVLPSYTPLGMASLLPHKTIEYSSSYDVLVDGKACSSTEQREAILKEYKVNSKCVQFDSMKTMKQADLRSIFTGQDVVYIYHNQIDARGDKAASENEVFTACEEAIEEIYTLIKRIASQANTYHFIVTADHGFIYKRDKIQATDKIAGAASKSNSVGQRYSISAEEIKADGVCHTTVSKVLGSVDERIVSFPLASDIFKVAGAGQNYVHGGCSPQEMLVPMIDVKVDKGKKETSLAEIALVSLTSKITNLITTLDFVQTEPVSDIVKETSYRVYFISDNNEKISNENIVIADKKDKDTTKRMFRLRFNFKNKKYDKSQKYYLVAYDDRNDIEVLRHEIIMDIAFADDFGF